MNVIKKFLAVSSILVASNVAIASSGQATEYFCNNSDGWIRLAIEPGNSKFSYGKFDLAILETSVPDNAIKTLEYPGEVVRIVTHNSSAGGDPSFFLYVRVSNIEGSNNIHLQYEYANGNVGRFVGGLICKVFE